MVKAFGRHSPSCLEWPPPMNNHPCVLVLNNHSQVTWCHYKSMFTSLKQALHGLATILYPLPSHAPKLLPCAFSPLLQPFPQPPCTLSLSHAGFPGSGPVPVSRPHPGCAVCLLLGPSLLNLSMWKTIKVWASVISLYPIPGWLHPPLALNTIHMLMIRRCFTNLPCFGASGSCTPKHLP